MPLIAILRGMEPRDSLDIAEALVSAGFLCVEVPLNSPEALTSIAKIRARFDGKLLVGAGTVLSLTDVAEVQGAGAQFVVSPNTNPAVITATKHRGLLSVPGFATPTEAFAATDAGADAIKLFPAEGASPSMLRALKAVLPASCPILPVGGITPTNMTDYIAAGAAGFGIGSSIYKPGTRPQIVGERAASFVAAWRAQRG
jgi:2-dehydro-3-deoxyphosphogalactonate aldolase